MPIVSIDQLEQQSSPLSAPAKLSGIVSIDDLEKHTSDTEKSNASMNGAPVGVVSKTLAHATKGFYDTMHQIPGVRQFMDVNPELAEGMSKVPAPQGIGENLARMAGQGAGLIPAFEGGAAALGGKLLGGALGVGAQEAAGEVQEGKPLTQAAITGAASAAGTYVGGKLLEKAGQVIGDAVKPATERISDTIKDLYSKAVKPTIVKGNASMLNKANENVESGIRAIIKNKGSLNLGEEGVQVPETLAHASEAVSQTKDQIFNQYNNLQVQATGKGVTIDPEPLAAQLDSIINNKAMKIVSPKTVKYAQEVKNRLVGKEPVLDGEGNVIEAGHPGSGTLSPEEAQDMIKGFNGRLKAYYRNPSPNQYGNTAVDALVANNARKVLDDAITTATEPGYQALKNQYGALSSMEKDVSRAAQRAANYQNKGLLDFSDIFTGEQVARGVLTGNPAEMAAGVGGRLIKEYYKKLNNPDANIKNMFSKVSDLMSKEGQPSLAENISTVTQNVKQKLSSLLDAVPSRQFGLAGKVGSKGKISNGGAVEAELLGGKQKSLPNLPPQPLRTGPRYPSNDPTVNKQGLSLLHDTIALPGPSKAATTDLSVGPKTSRPIERNPQASVDMSKGSSGVTKPLAAAGIGGVTIQIDKNKDANIDRLSKEMKLNLQTLNEKLNKEGIQVRVTSGYRSPEEQMKLYNQGRKTPGKIVTNVVKSKHNDGHAIDLVVIKDGNVSYDPKDYKRIGEIGKSMGLVWGGDFKKLRDYGHLEISSVKKGEKK